MGDLLNACRDRGGRKGGRSKEGIGEQEGKTTVGTHTKKGKIAGSK
jgi:hypothetical protein